MKKYFYTVIFMMALLPALNANDLIGKAEKAYDSKKYKEAIDSYEQLLKEGYKSYQLYYNLGNACYRNNDVGKAIYYYELARKIEPNDEDISINLAKANARTIDKIESHENFFISAVKTNVLSSFSTTTWAWFTIFSLGLAAVLFFIFINSYNITFKRISFIASMVLMITFFVTYFLGYSAMKAKYENKFAIILSKDVKIMNEPTLSGSSKFNLHEGTKIRVVESNGDWLLIKLDNGNEGWLKMLDVGII
ncbi:MAG: tetratricopeptide repeat protein [Bacteroidia bacterium]|nr:tetratricopeptide repeat protein [Bacteroidia bacterium]